MVSEHLADRARFGLVIQGSRCTVGIHVVDVRGFHSGIIQGNLAARAGQVPHAERIIDEEIVEFQTWLDEIDIRPTVAEFKAYLEELKDKQVGFVRKKQNDEVATAVDKSLQQFIKKVVGKSVSTLKSSQTREERERDLATLKRLFSTDERD